MLNHFIMNLHHSHHSRQQTLSVVYYKEISLNIAVNSHSWKQKSNSRISSTPSSPLFDFLLLFLQYTKIQMTIYRFSIISYTLRPLAYTGGGEGESSPPLRAQRNNKRKRKRKGKRRENGKKMEKG